jgi:YggT family protein
MILAMILSVLFAALRIGELIVIGAVIATWLGLDREKPLVRLLHDLTEPVFRLVRPIARKLPGAFDWSPAIVLLGIELGRRLLGSLG